MEELQEQAENVVDAARGRIAEELTDSHEKVEGHIKLLRRATAAVSFFLTGVALGGVVAKIVKSREDRAARMAPR